MMRLVLDTNVLLVALPLGSPYEPIRTAIALGTVEWVISEPIYLEYVEILMNRGTSRSVAYFDDLVLNARTLIKVDPTFHWRCIYADPDDEKFVDAYITSDADFLVTWDKHFNVLADLKFPKVNLLNPEDLLQRLE